MLLNRVFRMNKSPNCFQSLCLMVVLFCIGWPVLVMANEQSSVLPPAEPSTHPLRELNQQYSALMQNEVPLNPESIQRLMASYEAMTVQLNQTDTSQQIMWHLAQLKRKMYSVTGERIWLHQALELLRRVSVNPQDRELAGLSHLTLADTYESDLNDPQTALMEYTSIWKAGPSSYRQLAAGHIKRLDPAWYRSLETSSDLQRLRHNPLKLPQLRGLSRLQSASRPKARITAINYWTHPDWARLVIQTDRPIPYVFDKPTAPEQTDQAPWFIHLLDSKLKTVPVSMLDEPSELMSRPHTKTLNNRVVEIRWNMLNQAKWHIHDLDQDGAYGITLEVKQPQTALPNSVLQQAPVHQVAFQPNPAKQQDEIQRVIIDPGHGGKDPGAVTEDFLEKDVVLDVAKQLRDQLRLITNLEVLLTREDDRFIPLAKRSAFARKHQGDLFVSIHLNANEDPEVNGMVSYFLSEAVDSESLRLAGFENDMSLNAVTSLSPIVRDLLRLSHTTTSEVLAHTIHNRLVQTITTHHSDPPLDLGVKHAPFVVLMDTGMPSVLLELTFATNPKDRKRLTDPHFRTLLANGIAQGIKAFTIKRQGASL